MPGHEARLLRPEMTQNIVNQGLELQRCAALGTHLVQSEVTVQISVPELLSLHFGVLALPEQARATSSARLCGNV